MTTAKTTCPFCLNGCTSGVSFDGYQYRMAYFTDAEVNKGCLCPRGNSASIVIDHPERLCRPILDGKDTTWSEAETLVRRWFAAAKPEELALVYSRGRDLDDVKMMHGLARELGTRNLACGHIEPENSFGHRLQGVADASLKDVEAAKVMLLVGDVFNTSPVASNRMIAARYADRKSRLVVVDSIRTRESGFAHVFIQTRPGGEPFALIALAVLIDPKVVSGVDVDRCADLAGVKVEPLKAAAAVLGLDLPGFVGSAMHTGRVFSPILHSLASQFVAKAAEQPFVGFRESALPAGLSSFADLRQAVGAGKIKTLFWTGGLFPYSYAELMPELDKVENRVATAIFRPDPPVRGLVLPVVAELERSSAGSSYWGAVERKPLAAPLSGTREFAHVLGWLGRCDKAKPAPVKPVAAGDIPAMVAKAAGVSLRTRMTLLGQKSAIGLRGFYDDESVAWLNPLEAAKLDVTDRNYVKVTSLSSAREFRVHVTDAVSPGVVSVGTNVHPNRALFPLGEDPVSGETTVPPAQVEVERSGRIYTQGGENPSVWL